MHRYENDSSLALLSLMPALGSIVFLVILLPLRITLLNNYIETDTGFYILSGKARSAFFCLSIAAVIFLALTCILIFLKTRRHYDQKPLSVSAFTSAAESVCGFVIAASSAVTIFRRLSYSHLGHSFTIKQFAVEILGVLSGLCLLYIASRRRTAQSCLSIPALTFVIPVLWQITHTLFSFLSYRVVLYISDALIDILFSCSLIVFLMLYGKSVTACASHRAIITTLYCGCYCFLFGMLLFLSHMICSLGENGLAWDILQFRYPVVLFSSLFCLFESISVSRFLLSKRSPD